MLREVLLSRSTCLHQLRPNFQQERKKFPFLVMKQTYLTTRTGLQRESLEKLQISSQTPVDHHGPMLLLPPLRDSMPLKMAVKTGQISVCNSSLIVTSLIMAARVAGPLRVTLTPQSMV
jgi:hypothetical protein